MVSAEEATGVKQEKKPRVRTKPKIGPSVQAEEKINKSVLQKFVKFLEKKGATKLAQKIGVKVAAMAGGALVPGVGWLFDAVLIASSIYDIYEAYQYWQEFKEEETAVKPTSYKQPLDQTKNPISVLPDAITSSDKKEILNSLEYKVLNGITLKSDELKIIAEKLVLSEDLVKLLTELAKKGSSQSSEQATAQADSQDRTRELTDVGARLGGGRSPAAKSQEAKPGEAGKNLTTVTAKKSGKSDKVGSAYASNFQGFLDDLEATGYQIKTLGGYSFRENKNNPSMLSYHGLGAALDVNAAANPFHTRQTDMPRNVGEIAKAHGLGWGISFEDPMHFSAAKREGGSFDIAQQRMPGYASGTPYVPQTGIATVGELGSETIVGKDGIKKTAAGAHTMMLRKGESVIPAGEKRSATEIAAEYKNAKAFADGTPQVKPLLAPGETTQPLQPIKIETPAEAKMKKYLEGVPFDPVLQAGMKKIGGVKNIIMKEDLLQKSHAYGAYVPPDAKGKNGASEKTLSGYRNKIFIDPKGGRPEQIKTTIEHELSHAGTQAYWENNLISPEMLNEIKGFTGKSPKDAGLYGTGLGEEARQRIRDLETRGNFMDYDDLEDVSFFVNKYKPYNEKGLTPDQIDEYEASRDKMLSNLNKDIKRASAESLYPEQALRIPEGSSIHMLDTMGQYK